MRLIILGSCSGTQPFPGRHHTSFIIEHRGKLYWFDAGETCSYTAHCMGLDLLKSSKIVISHTHMDHIGGLGNLLWTVRKLNGISGDFSGKRLDIYIPQVESYEAIIKMLQSTQGNFSADFELEAQTGFYLRRIALRLPPCTIGTYKMSPRPRVSGSLSAF